MERSEDEREALRRAIEEGKRQYDLENPPGPDVLPRDQWTVMPDDEGFRPYFTEDEVARSGQVFVPPEEARAFAREMYADEVGFPFPDDMMSALSLLSDEVAERVRALLQETREQAAERVEEFRTRLASWHARGSPRDDFPQKIL